MQSQLFAIPENVIYRCSLCNAELTEVLTHLTYDAEDGVSGALCPRCEALTAEATLIGLGQTPAEFFTQDSLF